MGWLILWILLVAAWLKMATWTSLLNRVRPWRTLQPPWQRYQRLLVRLEHLKTGFQLLNWFFTVVTISLMGYFVSKDEGLLVGIILSIVVAAVVMSLSYVEALQLLLLRLTLSVQGAHGTKLGFLVSFLRFCTSLGKLFYPDYPYWYDEKEMAAFVEFHHRRYKHTESDSEKQLVSLMKVDERKIGQLMVGLKDALLIKGDETIGPIVLKELHDSKYSVFGVYEEKRAHLVGILEQGVALSHASRNVKVSSLMDEHILYLAPDTSFKEALGTFMETNTTLAAIVDESSKPIGVIYLRDILGKLFGE
ncbi:MAG TPA: CBS domain-containing protein [Candidatus Saccharimonadales bacterium]|nr:CBS domain-containing protein [Candidatus Saccharimonadales bacterium]